MPNKNFYRKIEDFKCYNCNFLVNGNGYTDHCPKCLWGKHVDKKIPGDRLSNCKGKMEPISAEYQGGMFKISYRCQKCGYKFRVREGKNDSREKLMELVKINL